MTAWAAGSAEDDGLTVGLGATAELDASGDPVGTTAGSSGDAEDTAALSGDRMEASAAPAGDPSGETGDLHAAANASASASASVAPWLILGGCRASLRLLTASRLIADGERINHLACPACSGRLTSRAMRYVAAFPLVLFSLAIGCESSPTPDPSRASATPAKATAAPSATVASTASAATTASSATGSNATKPPDKENIAVDESKIDKSIPDIPNERSKPPTIEEWKTGTVVNSQGKSSRPDKCEMKIVRDWLKIKCEGDVLGINDLDGFGAEGTDHFKAYKEGLWADIVVRLKEGQALSTRIPRGAEGDAALFTHWPKGAKKPYIVALGRGAYPSYSSCGG